MNDLGMLLQCASNAVRSTPIMLYFDDPGWHWPMNAVGTVYEHCACIMDLVKACVEQRKAQGLPLSTKYASII